MKYRFIDADGPSTYIVILETGDEVAASLNRFAAENKLAGSSFKAIGAGHRTHSALANRPSYKSLAGSQRLSFGDHNYFRNSRL
jgi:predicted DNA-binding protein with PD1-like motif